MMKRLIPPLSALIFVGSCQVSPKPIAYGYDGCHFCSMTIVDKQHAAQYVTKKGKVYSFDATECMMNRLNEIDTEEVALFLVNDFNTPGELVDATTATFLISKNIPSPMGAYLSAFESKKQAALVHSESKGKLLSWESLNDRFAKK